MDISKDYYAILGLLPSAEAGVIRAAYRALAQRYHPDRSEGTEDTTARMADLNEAYAVLSDPSARAEYDRLRGAGAKSGEGYFGGQGQTPPSGEDPLDADWKLAAEYYPDLMNLESRLAKFSWRLAYSFRAAMLETKRFEQRAEMAAQLESQFLRVYFGDDFRVVSFAKALVENGYRDAARALNDAVRVLGSAADPQRILSKITADFSLSDVGNSAKRSEDVRALAATLRGGWASTANYVEFFRLLGGEFSFEQKLFSTKCFADINGIEHEFDTSGDFQSWVRESLLPQVRE